MLNLWRRHLKSCPHRVRTYKKCGCPIWVQGTLHGKWLKKSLDLRNWEGAQRLVRDWEAGASAHSVPLKDACERFQSDCEARKLGSAQLGKYKLLTEDLKKEFPNRLVGSISTDDLRTYREGWSVGSVTASKKLERLRTFFKFCQESGWIATNPAKVLKAPQGKAAPTLPFSDPEMEKILWAAEQYPELFPMSREYGKKVKPFILLLQYSGLRIRDAVCLRTDALKDGKLFLRTAKTETPVWIPLPKSVVESLKSIKDFGGYFFWSGNGLPKSAVADWQRTLAKVFKAAGVKGHAHRFRDTFSVNLLQKGVALETVSVLLGHSNSRITAKYYNPWVKSRQIALESEIQKAWRLSG
jgi:integrase/recombinase XerD